jgi:hypothetical protein
MADRGTSGIRSSLNPTKARMIPAAPPGVKTDIVERFTISGIGPALVTTNISNRFDAIPHIGCMPPRG